MRTLQVGDLVCKVGESAQENWDLVDSARNYHWFFHLTDFPSPYVVLECVDRHGPNAHIKERCAEICVEHSKQRKTKKVKVDSTPCGNVKISRRDEVGECDYKSESKVEVVVVKGGKAGEEDAVEEHDGGTVKTKDHKKGTGKGERKGGYQGSDSKAGETTAPSLHVTVRKSVVGGWATLKFKNSSVRNAILREHEEICAGSGVVIKLQPQVDTKTKEEALDSIFASWGPKAEEKSPVSETELSKCFDLLASRAVDKLERAAPARAAGEHVQVRKAAVGGCAVISLCDAETRNAILALGTEITLETGVVVKLNPQRDPKTKEEVPLELFACWGRKVEEKTPVSEAELLRCLEGFRLRAAAPAEAGNESAESAPVVCE